MRGFVGMQLFYCSRNYRRQELRQMQRFQLRGVLESESVKIVMGVWVVWSMLRDQSVCTVRVLHLTFVPF